MSKHAMVSLTEIERSIHYIRNRRVMLSSDLAAIYDVKPKVLVQAVKRNIKRFPADFMFQLNKKEADAFLRFQFYTSENENLRFQNGTSSYGGRRYAPYVFTEQGVAMLSAVLRSQRAVAVSIQVVRTFVKLREILSTHKQLQEKMEKIESKYDKNFKIVFQMIARLMKNDATPKDKIGFK